MAVIGRNDLEGADVLTGEGADAARAVVKVLLPDGRAATGFMVAPRILMTCRHVIAAEEQARTSRVVFNYGLDSRGGHEPTETVATEALIRTHRGLDYSLVRTAESRRRWGWIALGSGSVGRYAAGMEAIVIQHPRGGPKMVGRRCNAITQVAHESIYYTTDTDDDSSGAPVLDSGYRLLAVHAAVGTLEQGRWKDNRGFRADRIIEDLRSAAGDRVLAELEL